MTNKSTFVPDNNPGVHFSHIQLYCDSLEDLAVYKSLEASLNSDDDIVSSPTEFHPHGRDVVKQLLAGFGFRVTASCYKDHVRTVLITSRDPTGVKMVVTACSKDSCHDPTVQDVREFFQAHKERQGIGVLAFGATDVAGIHARYAALHPRLIAKWDATRSILEVYAYYRGDGDDSREADPGTILRFTPHGGESVCQVLGLEPVDATFDETSCAAYFDHWVSNVHSRTQFLDTLQETLGFTPKVDFNAGVIAAGQAQIESTVTGNDQSPDEKPAINKQDALKATSQVYLPINNALSQVGHVHGFLHEIGQGVQHIASRVEDLVEFCQQAHDRRKRTGEGFTFLRIPASYYGVLTEHDLRKASVSPETATAIMACLVRTGHLSKDGAVDLKLDQRKLDVVLQEGLETDGTAADYQRNRETVLSTILKSRYSNLLALLGSHLSEETYLGIVRNQILVDIQGDDLLYQIFTCNILQRNSGEEAPFFEFIQRVCSEKLDEAGCPRKIRPGCGGFGIRNFLTLFLSIEVSNAMQEVVDAQREGDIPRRDYAQSMVDCLTAQLNESNPILTELSEAMTLEGECQTRLQAATSKEEIAKLLQSKAEASERKRVGNVRLMECSSRYNDLMKALQEARDE